MRLSKHNITSCKEPYNPDTQKSLGVDVGFGSSKTAFVIIEYIDGLVHVIYSKQFENSSTNQIAAHTYNLIKRYRLENGSNKTFVDGWYECFLVQPA